MGWVTSRSGWLLELLTELTKGLSQICKNCLPQLFLDSEAGARLVGWLEGLVDAQRVLLFSLFLDQLESLEDTHKSAFLLLHLLLVMPLPLHLYMVAMINLHMIACTLHKRNRLVGILVFS